MTAHPPAVVLSARRVPGTGQPFAVALCCFRACEWSSDTVPTAPTEVADELIARHLLADHEDALRTLGRLARDADLIP